VCGLHNVVGRRERERERGMCLSEFTCQANIDLGQDLASQNSFCLEVRKWEGVEGKGRGKGKGGEMTQTLYAHMNKRKNKDLASLT
jgi:hypothetical protein